MKKAFEAIGGRSYYRQATVESEVSNIATLAHACPVYTVQVRQKTGPDPRADTSPPTRPHAPSGLTIRHAIPWRRLEMRPFPPKRA
ncbi:MAG: hypothetical protein H8E35_04145 [Ardenticatenia bacterium]|nr:hypothetical protein [Ardenticatenia bacterium]